MTPELEARIQRLEEELNNLKTSYTIPLEVDNAFRDRLGIADFAALTGSTKAASTETQAVAEGGSASYNVAKPMDGFREFITGGTTLYIPYYT